MLKSWLKQLADEIARVRDEFCAVPHQGKAKDFAKKMRVSNSTLSIMANGNRPYSIDGLLNVLAYDSDDRPVERILSMEFPSVSQEHIKAHHRFQKLLESEDANAKAALMMVDGAARMVFGPDVQDPKE